MSRMIPFDAANHNVGLSRNLEATVHSAQADPGPRVEGVMIGMVTMTENSPHDGEMHPDGDEVLYLASGRVRVTIELEPVEVFEMKPGDGAVVPKRVWHKVDILEPSCIFFATPGPNGEYRPLGSQD